MSTIVIATDGSKAALNATELGLEIAEGAGDDVVFVSVWDVVQSAFGHSFAYMEPRYLECDRERAEAVLVASKALASRYGIEAETVVLAGDAPTEICKLAAERNARLIVLGSHGWGALRGFMFGSVAAEVLRHAPCPVLSGTPATRELLEPQELVGPGASGHRE